MVVIELADRFAVTTETVRRDLDQLEHAGLVRRVHGGAVQASRVSTIEVPLAQRELQRSEAKHAIALRALSGVRAASGSIYLDAGTTVGALASLLGASTSPHPFRDVVTHSMTVADSLAGTPGLELTAIGGRVRSLTAAAVGARTVREIESIRPDVAFVGTNGLSASFGLSTPDPDEADVKRALVRAARQVIVLADADKLGRELLVSFATPADIDVLVTDKPVPADVKAALDEAEVEIWIP